MGDDELVQAAKAAQWRAYAPYSGYRVGAAVRDEMGRIHAGCNVENVAYPVTLCAERAAIAHMIAAGGAKIRSVSVVTRDGGTPCGMCLQALLEFVDDPSEVTVSCVATDGGTSTFVLSELMPQAFRSAEVSRTPPKP